MKAYILMQKGYEYDDNYYTSPECGGGTPTKIYFQHSDAQIEENKLNIEALKSTDISLYTGGDNMEYYINVTTEELIEYVNSLVKKYGSPILGRYQRSFGVYQLHPDANEEESNKYLQMVHIRFYEISETDVDLPSLRDNQINSVIS